METNIGISSENSSHVARILEVILADVFVLYTKTRNAHWNIEGPNFYSKHTFFEGQYETLDEVMDSVAERIRMIGHYAPASLQDFLKLTRLTEQHRQSNTSEGYNRMLLGDHESIIIYLREYINKIANDYSDIGTSDFLTGVMETLEKMAWMLRAHLK